SQLALMEIYPGFADINGDGHQDLYFTGTTLSPRQVLIYYVLSEEGSFSDDASINTLPVALANNDRVALGDINGDKSADVIIARTTGRMDYYNFTGTTILPSYTLITENFAGFTDKFENRNLIPFIADYDGDDQAELILSNADGNL